MTATDPPERRRHTDLQEPPVPRVTKGAGAKKKGSRARTEALRRGKSPPGRLLARRRLDADLSQADLAEATLGNRGRDGQISKVELGHPPYTAAWLRKRPDFVKAWLLRCDPAWGTKTRALMLRICGEVVSADRQGKVADFLAFMSEWSEGLQDSDAKVNKANTATLGAVKRFAPIMSDPNAQGAAARRVARFLNEKPLPGETDERFIWRMRAHLRWLIRQIVG